MGKLSRIRHFALKTIMKLQYVPRKWNVWRFTLVRWLHMVCYLVLCPLNCKKHFARKIFHERCQNLQNLRRFFIDISLLQVHVFIININTKIFIVFSTCKQNHKASIIWGKELEVSLFMLKWSFIVNSLFA